MPDRISQVGSRWYSCAVVVEGTVSHLTDAHQRRIKCLKYIRYHSTEGTTIACSWVHEAKIVIVSPT